MTNVWGRRPHVFSNLVERSGPQTPPDIIVAPFCLTYFCLLAYLGLDNCKSGRSKKPELATGYNSRVASPLREEPGEALGGQAASLRFRVFQGRATLGFLIHGGHARVFNTCIFSYMVF